MARQRSRLPVVCGALVLLWCAWWYCRGGGQGLLMVAAGIAAVTAALPRALPGNTRWVVWTWLILTVVCLAANVERLVPPERALGEGRVLERIITALFAMGVTALFFRPGVIGVTLVALGGMPMVMLTLGRSARETGSAAGFEDVIVWGFVALVIALDQVQRLASPRGAGQLPAGLRELAVRGAILLAVLGLAVGLRAPIEQVAIVIQKKLFGLVVDSEQGSLARRGFDLSLGHALPKDFGKRLRAILLIRSAGMPGYLREEVFVTYHSGHWVGLRPGNGLRPLDAPPGGGGQAAYGLVAKAAPEASAAWRVEVLAPRMLRGFCLPGSARSLACDGPVPLGEANGMVTPHDVWPDRYDLTVVRRRLMESPYPAPEGFSESAYLAVPRVLAASASNWVAECAGFAGAASVREAVVRAENHFATNFSYQLGVTLRYAPDPLVDFMKRRTGSCTHFASAAALMFRTCGIPSRVVAGYVCCEWNPWLDRWVVREREGHAWVEVWDASEGRWLLADPTPPEGHPSSWGKPGRIRLAIDLLLASWKRLLFGIKNTDPLVFIAEAGTVLALFVWQAVWSPAGVVVLAGFALLGWLRRRTSRRMRTAEEQVRDELTAGMRDLAKRAVKEHLRRRAYESWSAWLRRVKPQLASGAYEELFELAEAYQELRYRSGFDAPAARAWLERARRTRR